MSRVAVTLALVFSGLTALVYQVLWTRLLGFVFGTTSEAIGSVLAVFFAGMAIGNWLAAGRLGRVRRPLRLYAWLELGIGLWAVLSLPLLRALPGIHGLSGDPGPWLAAGVRLGATALVLLPATVAMGATLPVVARGVVGDDATLGRWSALLYAANTLGAVAGAYLCGFWLLPGLGLAASVYGAAAVNGLVAAAILALLRDAPAAASNAAPGPAPEAAAERGGPAQGQAADARRAAFLAYFAVSGFVAIGYEIAWSKVFGIVMEGTVYGFSAVLSAYLAGIALGSAAVAPFVDRIRDLPRAFGLLHVGAGVAVAAGLVLVPYLPWAHARLADLAQTSGQGGDAVHLLFLLVIPIVLAPTALFGAAFPILIRIYTRRAAAVGEGMGRAVALNTAGSIASSLLVGFWAIPRLGMDATLYALVMLDLALAAWVLLRHASGKGRLPSLATAGAGLALVAVGWNGVHAELAVAGRDVDASALGAYTEALEARARSQVFVTEGRNAIVTVTAGTASRGLHTNGLPEAGVYLGPPYSPVTTTLLGALPYLAAERVDRALVIGLGAGNTVETLRHTEVRRIDVVELEEGVVRAMRVLHEGLPDPLADPRVHLRVNDGRNELLRARHAGRRWDMIASQPSHPWLIGAANLFTEEFFALARDALRPGGAFALWVNGFRTDRRALLAMVASFERVFPGAVVADVSEGHARKAFLLLGMREPVRLDPERMAARLAYPPLARHLAHNGLERIPALLARFEAHAADLVPLAGGDRNTDDNAFVETRIPRQLTWQQLDWSEVEARLPGDAPVLPPLTAPVDAGAAAEAVLDAVARAPDPRPLRKVARLLRVHGEGVDPLRAGVLRARAALMQPETRASGEADLRRLADAHPGRPEPLRALGRHLAARVRDFPAAGEAFAAAHARSGDPRDAYDAARALHYVDPERAWRWVERIPASVREAYPRLAWYEAERALRAGERGPALRGRLERLRAWRDTDEGRRVPGVDATLARLAGALGEARLARAFREADRRGRVTRAQPHLDGAREALATGRLEEAGRHVEAADALLPGHTEVAHLRARLAVARRDGAALEAALADLRAWAPTLADAVTAENRFRASAGLPLLAEQPPERFDR